MTQRHILGGLIKWMEREPWNERFLDVLGGHSVEACEEAGIEVHEIADVLGQPAAMMLWGAAFEDFLSRPYGEDGESLVDEYLRRRGWKETGVNRRYMEAVRDSVVSLYEVSGIVSGESFLARDLIRGGEPIRVSERSATTMFRPWDRIAARIVVVDGKTMMTGGTLVLGQDAADELVEHFKAAPDAVRQSFREAAAKVGGMEGFDPDALIDDRVVLGMSAESFTLAWLDESLRRALRRPEVVNSDGDPIAFRTVRYPLRSGAADAVQQRLRGHAALREEEAGTFWNWIETDTPPRRRKGDVEVLTTTLSDGAAVLGTIELEDDAVVLRVNSPGRADQGQTMLTPLLGELVGAPLAATEVPQPDAEAGTEAADTAAIPMPGSEAIVREYLDRHYHAILDKPIQALDDETPRAAGRTPHGRAKLAAWLKYMENRTAANPNPALDYDFGWMWSELGVADLRR